MSDNVPDDCHALFIAAIRDLAAINEALGCDPDDGGSVPIIEAIDALKAECSALKAALTDVAYSNRTRGSMKQMARYAIAAQKGGAR